MSQNYQAFLDERCEKLGTNHNVDSFSIRSFLLLKEQMIIPVKTNVKQRWSYWRKIDQF